MNAYLTLLSALAISAVAAWFSIIGLTAIFAGAFVPVLIMAVVLEIGKLVAASWLYWNWNSAKFILKWLLTVLVIILMAITSMGIFGFLSKAHIEQGAPVTNNSAKIEIIDNKIDREQRTIDDADKVVLQLDNAVETLIKYDRIRGKDGSIAVRIEQKDERKMLSEIVSSSQDIIDDLNDERFELQQTLRNFEVEIGPIKYIAELIYTDGESRLEDTVRYAILIIVMVFDPLAILLLIAANTTLKGSRKAALPVAAKEILEEPEAPKEEVIEPVNSDINVTYNVSLDVSEVEDHPEEIVEDINEKVDDTVEEIVEEIVEDINEKVDDTVEEIVEEEVVEIKEVEVEKPPKPKPANNWIFDNSPNSDGQKQGE